jgi:hypothetical protein
VKKYQRLFVHNMTRAAWFLLILERFSSSSLNSNL